MAGVFEWDDTQRLAGFSYILGATAFLERVFTRDGLGLKMEEEIVAGRVGDLQPKVECMTFDGADRLSQTLRVAAPGDEAWTTNAFYFDPNGNLVSNGMGLAMGYDHDNRMTNVVNEGTASAYEYDGLGDRVTRHSLQGTRHFVLDRGAALHNVLMEADTNGLPVRYYIWGARGLLAQVETNGAVYYFHADEQGSTLALTDTNGAVVAEYAYSPYGEVLDQAGGVETPYTFGGGYGAYHEGGSLYYIKARYYAADLRRWLTKDPIGLPGGLNLYAYCHGDPVNFIDPWGWGESWAQGRVGDVYLYVDNNIIQWIIAIFTADANTPGDVYGHVGIRVQDGILTARPGDGVVIDAPDSLDGKTFQIMRPNGAVDEAGLLKFAGQALVGGTFGGYDYGAIVGIQSSDGSEYTCGSLVADGLRAAGVPIVHDSQTTPNEISRSVFLAPVNGGAISIGARGSRGSVSSTSSANTVIRASFP
ncbi:MAG TPA: RHS repeat-associated core domain-containing protein [Kiritimatiellia bacterium]|nr:RHS repeat-associated core domain-containing protein [Kiritimatiellia bacterium]